MAVRDFRGVQNGFIKYVFLAVSLNPTVSCVSQRKILLIGTHHTTPKDRLIEIMPIASALEDFRPEIFCVEYPIPTDTASVKYKGGEDIFQRKEAMQKEWKIPRGDMNKNIESLQQYSHLNSDIQKQMELQQLYFLSSDVCNADYQGYLIMTQTERSTQNADWIRKNSPGFRVMKEIYEAKRHRNDEYYSLVFPLAIKLNIQHIYPIDDLSTWKDYEKYYDKLQVLDTANEDKIKFHKHAEYFYKKLKSLPKDSNQWIFSNSPQTIQDLLYVEGYKIDDDISNNDIKMLQYYWVSRNRIIAQHIADVARNHPRTRLVVFFGASHVGPVLEELKKLNNDYQVLTLLDIMKN
ncbi:MAG TPA: DUF5694 domain-containing protein [Cyclobacteriaceae bacterium]|nr:DUF5694 domain-containing protein [Cyclobacteriaceae bacterium]